MCSNIYIQKNPESKALFYNRIYYFNSAREGFGKLLSDLSSDTFTLFLPAYIGISPKEGSGIYDPVLENRIQHVFYRIDSKLRVDLEDLRTQLKTVTGEKAILLVHYWGYVDPNYQLIAQMANEYGCILIEDMAHALFTEYVDHACGTDCDASFYSLHKMFPYPSGGMLKIHNERIGQGIIQPENGVHFPAEYDFLAISDIRKRNAAHWERLLRNYTDEFEILRPTEEYPNQTPQSFPVKVLRRDRFELYLKLNEKGFGAISLYHTMIEPIQKGDYPESMKLSSTILNFPIHQDTTQSNIADMFNCLQSIIADKHA